MDNLLSKVALLKPSRYAYRNNNPTGRESLGFVAQEVRQLFPELVYENTDAKSGKILTLDYSGFGVIAIKAIQEQQEIIDDQIKKIETLEYRLEAIEALLSSIKK